MEKYGVDKRSVEDDMEKKAYAKKKWPAPSAEEVKKLKGQKLKNKDLNK